MGLNRFKEKILRYSVLQGLPYWVSATLTGLIAVGYAKIILLLSQYPLRIYQSRPWMLLLITPLCFLIGWWIVSRFAPEAGGSGIPQVMAAHDLDHDQDSNQIQRLLGIKTTLIKLLSSFICILGGGAIGREGPTIQIAASIFHAIGTRFKTYWPEMSHRSWIVAGGAAGIASAFNTPLGGIVYAIEELSSTGFGEFRTVLISAVIISGMVAQWIAGPYLYLGYPPLQDISFRILPLALFTGIISGVLGGAFGKLLEKAVEWKANLTFRWAPALTALGTGLGFACLAWSIDQSVLGSGVELITHLLFQNPQETHWSWIIGRFFGSLLSYASGCAGGIFAPSLAIGGTIGAEIGKYFESGNPNLMILLGMIGFLTGVTRAPFTAFVLVLEMTDRHSAIFPMMVTAIVALGASQLTSRHSFYEHMEKRYLKVA